MTQNTGISWHVVRVSLFFADYNKTTLMLRAEFLWILWIGSIGKVIVLNLFNQYSFSHTQDVEWIKIHIYTLFDRWIYRNILCIEISYDFIEIYYRNIFCYICQGLQVFFLFFIIYIFYMVPNLLGLQSWLVFFIIIGS